MSTAEVLTPLPTLWSAMIWTTATTTRLLMVSEWELPPMSIDSQAITSRLVWLLSSYGIPQGVGEAYAEMLFKLPLKKDRNRKPDAAFVSYSRWPKYKPIPSTNAWDVLPELCVEVVSPNDLADEIRNENRGVFFSPV